jgi:hypothetical protein
MLTRKHYIELAEVIADSTKGSGCRLSLEVALIDWLQKNNPAFDRARFRAAIKKFETAK